jgi:hypothetical protein
MIPESYVSFLRKILVLSALYFIVAQIVASYRDNPDLLAEEQSWVEYFNQFIAPDEEPYEPIMDIYYPIVNDISRVITVGRKDYNVKNNTLVGLLASPVYWRSLIRDALPPGSNGITVVFNNTCTRSFTYQVNGPNVVFMGVNDRHEIKYDSFRVSRQISELENSSFTSTAYSGAPISESHCPYCR